MLIACVAFTTWSANSKNQPLPTDPQLLMGRLDNGLTYYIRHNEQPKGRAEFRLVQSTGSLVEEEDERGLAHFLEHIAFQGSLHFPGLAMVDCLQQHGVPFGSCINASTGFDDTEFRISQVPTQQPELLDSVLLMLRDLSCGLTLDSLAIERERGVIEQEWRQSEGHTMRMYESVLPILLYGSRYPQRIAIGDMNVVRHFQRQQLVDFYRRWYCPGRQALVIVGDFDAQRMERQVQQLLGDIPSCEGDALVQEEVIPDHDGVNYALYTDPEASSSMVYLMFQHDPMPRHQRATLSYLQHNLVVALVQDLLSRRLQDLAGQEATPYEYATVYDRDFIVARSKQALTLAALAKQGRSLETLDTLLVEAARVVQHGFVESELQRARADMRASIESVLADVNNHQSADYVEEYVDHYSNGGYIPGVEAESQLMLNELEHIGVRQLNDYLRSVIKSDNVSVLISGPNSMGSQSLYPTSRDVIAHFGRIMHEPQSPYIDVTSEATLLANLPQRGAIVSETLDSLTGITTMQLSNGATVQLKPTDYSSNEILFNALSWGGEWAFGDSADVNVRVMSSLIEEASLGGHTVTELKKMLAGKQLSLSFQLNDPTEQLSGGCAPQDLETLLQIGYLYFTDVSIDDNTFAAFKDRLLSHVSQRANDPRTVYADSIASTIYCGNPMYRSLSRSDVEHIDPQRVLQLYRQRVADAGDFTFSMVGAFTIDQVRPLIERYIASLPDRGHREQQGGYVPPINHGYVDNMFRVPMRNPKTSVYVSLMGDCPYSFENEFLIDIAGDAIGAALLSYLRQEKNGIYDIASEATLSIHHNRWMINYEFETAPDNRDSMLVAADYATQVILEQGISKELYEKMKEQIRLKHESSLHTNGYWMFALQQRIVGIDIIAGFEQFYPTLTQERINNFLHQLKPHTRLRIVMN